MIIIIRESRQTRKRLVWRLVRAVRRKRKLRSRIAATARSPGRSCSETDKSCVSAELETTVWWRCSRPDWPPLVLNSTREKWVFAVVSRRTEGAEAEIEMGQWVKRVTIWTGHMGHGSPAAGPGICERGAGWAMTHPKILVG